MRSTLTFWRLGCVLLLFSASVLRAQMSEEEKKELFLQAREDIHPVAAVHPSATPRPKPRTVATPEPTARPKKAIVPDEGDDIPPPHKKAIPVPDEDEPPVHKHHVPQPEEPEPTPHPKAALAAEEEAMPTPHKKATSAPDDDFIPAPGQKLPAHAEESQEPAIHSSAATASPGNGITIEKSGFEESQGYEPAPKYTSSWWFHSRWTYLTPSVRRAIDNAPVQKGRWKYIVVHNSGTRQGNAHIFDVYHRRVRHMVNGLAYHFVIGNGSSSGDGQIEIGNRWTRQINGGHVASDYLNNIALGICLVGDFNRDVPTKAQMAALDELITYLRSRVGKVKGKPVIVVPHKIINPKPTDCPGDRFPYSWLKQKFG